MLGLTVSRLVYVGVRHPSGAREYYRQTVASLLTWEASSGCRKGLWFTIAASELPLAHNFLAVNE
jgi:hypothetical protein